MKVRHLYRVVLLALSVACLCACAEEVKTPPAELIDTWHSRAQHLSGRSLEIRSDWVVFNAGRFAMKMYPLVQVEQETRRGGTHYTLHYRGEGNEERQLGVLYKAGRPETLTLDNRDEIWVRTQDAAWLQENENS